MAHRMALKSISLTPDNTTTRDGILIVPTPSEYGQEAG